MFSITLSPDALAFFSAAQRPLARKLARCFAALERDPRSGNNVKRLTGDLSPYHRYRVGDWRVLYRINDQTQQVIVDSIAHRGEIFE